MNHYEEFNRLHEGPGAFVLANVWNVRSAQIAQAKGFKAVGTSSAAVADSMGYADGEKMPFSEMLYIVKRMRAAIDIPLSVDMERGYTDDLNELNTHVQLLIDAGVAGINLEDNQGEELYLQKLRSISAHLKKTGQHLFINARTDAFLQKDASPIETTLRRATLYSEAGANGLFVTGFHDATTVQRLTAGTSLPVNVVATPLLSTVHELEECGVRRISMAVFLYKATYRGMEAIAEKIISEGSFSALH